MKTFVLATLVAMTFGLLGATPSSAAPASGAPLAAAAGEIGCATQVWFDRYGRWHPKRPVYRRAAVFRTFRICGPRGCYWKRRCY
jgi:hypothetical protein